jgi:hypothetical protein
MSPEEVLGVKIALSRKKSISAGLVAQKIIHLKEFYFVFIGL